MSEQTTTVATPLRVRAAVWLVLPILGGGLLVLVLLFLRWAPFPIPFGITRAVPFPAARIGAIVAGVAGGALLAALVDAESLTVRITGASVVLTRPGTSRMVPRAEIAVAFAEGDRLVLLGRTGHELAREPSHLSARRLQPAFAAWEIDWSARDPYLDSYQRWVPGSPDLPARIDALLAERKRALTAKDERDSRELRDELGRLGYIIRDDHGRQQWRQVPP